MGYPGYWFGHSDVYVPSDRTVRELLAEGANVNANDRFGKTPLMYALHWRKPRSLKLLLRRGASVNAVDNFGQTALTRAAEYGYAGAVRLLLARGA